MKKFAVLALLMTLTFGAFATEKDFSIQIDVPTFMGLNNGGAKATMFGVGITGDNYFTESVGLYSAAYFNKANGGISIDTKIGVAIRPLNTEKFSLVLAPVADINFIFGGGLAMFIGAGLDVTANYKINEQFYITAGTDVDYYLFGLADTGSGMGFGSASALLINPHAGITIKM